MAASLFSVSRLIGQARPGSNSNTSWLVADTTPEKDNQSQQSSLSVESENEMSKIDSQPEMRSSKTEETLEEADYNVLLPISAKASFGEWTDTGEKQCLATNWTPVVDISKKGETSPSTLPSIPDWTHLEFDGGMMSEDQLKRERATHAEEMLIMKEVKEKLGERVKELEEELHEAVSELHLKTEQITKFIIDHDEEEVEIKELKEENERIQEAAACERQKFLDERRSNEVTKELKDAMIVELLANQDGMQKRIDVVIGYLSESQARVAELESANEVQAKKLLEKEVLLSDTIAILERQNANLIDQVQELRFQARAAQLQPSGELAKVFRGKDAVLKGQKATLIAQVEELRAIAKVNERQNSVLLVQLGQKFEDVESNVATKAARRTIRPILIEQAVRTVKALNDHIYHFAASLTDCVDGIEKEFFEESDTSTLETLKSLLGRKIFTQLEEESRMMKDEYNRFILQTGFQTCLTASCMHIITLWDPAEPESGKILEIVYKKMRGEAENATQWNYTSSTKTGRGILSSFINVNLYAVLGIAGWAKLEETTRLLDKFSGGISEIVNLAVRLNELVATTMCGDFKVTMIKEGRNYVSESMTIDSPEGEWDIDMPTPYLQVVVACVGFGLMWRQGDLNLLVLKPRVIVRKLYKPYPDYSNNVID